MVVLSLGAVAITVDPLHVGESAAARRAPHRHASAYARGAVDQISSFGPGSWCWFGDPRAVHVVGQYDQTFVGWVSTTGDVMIGSYDNRSRAVHTSIVGHLWHDDHGSPAILVEPDNRLTVFYSGHNGHDMYFKTSLRPEDISAWGPIERVPTNVVGRDGHTYPNPVIMPAESNRLWLFWRGGDYSQDYATRGIDGTWTHARRLIGTPGHQRPYVKVATNGSNEIAFAFTNGHPRERLTSVYYALYRNGSMWRADGSWIKRLSDGPIMPRDSSLVYDANKTGVSAWVWDVAFGSNGVPVIVYATFPSVHNHVYWYARWNGKRWEHHFLTFAGPSISPDTLEKQYSGGITLDQSNPSIVYLSRQVHGWFDIERWTTANGGSTWQRRTIVDTPGVSNMRPVVPRGQTGGPMGLLWLRGHYGSYSTYQTSISFLQ
jgi:hypothetical protein